MNCRTINFDDDPRTLNSPTSKLQTLYTVQILSTNSCLTTWNVNDFIGFKRI